MYPAHEGVDLSKVPSETFTITAPADQIDGLVKQRIDAFNDKIETKTRANSLGVNPLARREVFGSCGSSYVYLGATGSYRQGQGYLEAGWWINPAFARSTGTYEHNVLFFSTSHLDGHTQNFSDSGNQGGRESMAWSTRVTIPKKQEYGATLNRGAVTVVFVSNGRAGICVTEGPRVDGVLLYK